MTLYSVRWTERDSAEHITTTDLPETTRALVEMLRMRDIPSEIMNMSDHAVSFQHVLSPGRWVGYQGKRTTVRGIVPGIDLVYLRHPDGGDNLDIMVRHNTITW